MKNVRSGKASPKLMMRVLFGLGVFLFSLQVGVTGRAEVKNRNKAEGPLVVHSENRRYLMVEGDSTRRAVVLSGSHTWAEFQTYKDEEFDYIDWLDKLVEWNHNFMRGWMWEDDYYSPLPYAKSGGKYDLSKYNAEYFDLLKRRIGEAEERGIYNERYAVRGLECSRARSRSQPGSVAPASVPC